MFYTNRVDPPVCYTLYTQSAILAHSHFTDYAAGTGSLRQRFPNLWVTSRFVVGREKFLICDFFNCIKIKNHKK
jgi:hypothetical protein